MTKKANFEDRGVGTIMDGYTTTDKIADIIKFYLGENSLRDLRNGLAFWLSHFCLLRGEAARRAEFPDLQLIQLEGEGADKCPALVMVMRQGKTNKYGKLEGACLRNKRVEICPFIILGMCFFARFHVESEPFPDFTISENRFLTKVLKHQQDPCEEWPYHSYLDAITKAFKARSITSSKKTHVNRGSGARMAELQCVPESDIRKLGGWNNSSLNGSYLTGLPRGIMRNLAGFSIQHPK